MIVRLGEEAPERYRYIDLRDWFEDPELPTDDELLMLELETGVREVVVDMCSPLWDIDNEVGTFSGVSPNGWLFIRGITKGENIGYERWKREVSEL